MSLENSCGVLLTSRGSGFVSVLGEVSEVSVQGLGEVLASLVGFLVGRVIAIVEVGVRGRIELGFVRMICCLGSE